MPRIPDIATLGARPTPTPQTGAATIDASPIGRANEKLGEAGLQFAKEYSRHLAIETEKTNRLRAEDATNQLLNAEQDLSIGEENGFAHVQGGDAVTRPLTKDNTDLFNERRKAIADTLATPEQRQIFDSRANAIARGFQGKVITHVAKERGVYENQVLTGAEGAAVSNAAANYGSDDSVDTYLSRYDFLAGDILKSQGVPQDEIDRRRASVRDKVWGSRLTAEAAKDPVGAYTRLQANRENMSAATYQHMESQLFTAAADLMAIRAQQALPKVQSQVAPAVPAASGGTVVVSQAVEKFAPTIDMHAADYGVDPGVMRRQLQAESGGNPNARNDGDIRVTGSPSLGIAQFQPATAKRYGIDPMQPEQAIRGQAAYMADLLKMFGGDYQKALAGYNWGEGNVQKAVAQYGDAWLDHAPKSTQAYVGKIGGPDTRPAPQDRAALTLATMTPAQAAEVKTGDELIDRLPPQRKLAVLQKAHAQVRQDQQVFRQQLEGRDRDARAEFLVTGGATNPPSRAEYLAADPVNGERRYQSLQETAQTGRNIQLVKTLPQSDLEALRAQKPAAGDGFAERQRNYELLDHAIGQVQQQRQADPVAYALSAKSYGIQPITADQFTKDIPAVQAELGRRARAAGVMSQDYGTAPALLTKAESSALSSVIRQSPIPAQKQYLAAVYSGVGDINTYKAVLQQISPDAPTVALAGLYQVKQYQSEGERGRRDVADLILRGHAILNPPRKEDGGEHIGGKALVKMPAEEQMRLAFNGYVGDAFKDKEKAKDVAWQAAREIYAARQSEEGDDSGNLVPDRWKSAIELATGGIEKHKGSSIVLPWGVSYDSFRDKLGRKTEEIAPQALRATAAELANLPLENVGDGRYVFQRGAGYVVDQSGRPLVLDFNTGTPDAPRAITVPAAKLTVRDFSVNRGGAVTGRGR